LQTKQENQRDHEIKFKSLGPENASLKKKLVVIKKEISENKKEEEKLKKENERIDAHRGWGGKGQSKYRTPGPTQANKKTLVIKMQ